MEWTATILIAVGAVTILASGIVRQRVDHFRPRHRETAAAAVARARQLQLAATALAVIAVVCGATAAALNNGSTTMWVCGTVVLVAGAAQCSLTARVRIPDVQHLRDLGFDKGKDAP
ncbi:hypothetical protein [Gordonia sp. IITR100]|uniref:hypothetical protein n=1 Tax=Gordonia sp. IITR100 TaxID=1314686 RepID=UPI000990E570|nr:hypothetical protein [Gordonia sp. IITR100]